MTLVYNLVSQNLALETTMIIYVITNLINGKQYVGQTIRTLEIRWRGHCWECAIRSNMPISYAIKKYGKHNFSIVKICDCTSLEDMNEKELFWAKHLNTFCPNGYNLKAGDGKGSLSEETKRKIGMSNKGKKASLETIQKLRDSHLGFKVSQKTKDKLSKHFKGKKQNPDHVIIRSEITRKIYTIKSPTNELITFKGLNKFCQERGLSAGKLSRVLNGKAQTHKGWTRP